MTIHAMQLCLTALTACGIIQMLASSWSVSRSGYWNTSQFFIDYVGVDGLAELWLRGGVGDKTRFIPLHVIAGKVGKPVCEVLPATHALTGCNITSKFTTKAAGIKAQPVLYLKDFGRAHTDVQDCVQNAERQWRIQL